MWYYSCIGFIPKDKIPEDVEINEQTINELDEVVKEEQIYRTNSKKLLKDVCRYDACAKYNYKINHRYTSTDLIELNNIEKEAEDNNYKIFYFYNPYSSTNEKHINCLCRYGVRTLEPEEDESEK